MRACVYAYFFVPSDICLLDQFLSRHARTNFPTFPRSYCHPTQPILQLHSHYLQKKWLHFASNLQYPPSSELEWNIEYRMQIDNLSFFTNNARSLAYVRIFLYLCSEFGEWAFVSPEP